MANFYISKDFTKDIEGGFWNDPSAGWTYAGITKKYYPLWAGFFRLQQLKHKFYPAKDIPRYTIFEDQLLDNYVTEFYRNNFWNKILSGDLITNQTIANFIYDFIVHKQYDAVRVINDSARKLNDVIKTYKTSLSGDVIEVMNDNPSSFYSSLKNARINYYKNSINFSPKYKKDFIDRVKKFPLSVSGIVRYDPWI